MKRTGLLFWTTVNGILALEKNLLDTHQDRCTVACKGLICGLMGSKGVWRCVVGCSGVWR